MFISKNNRLWIHSATPDIEKNIVIDIFEKGIFLNSIKLPFSSLSEFSLYGKWFKVMDHEKNTLSIYEY